MKQKSHVQFRFSVTWLFLSEKKDPIKKIDLALIKQKSHVQFNFPMTWLFLSEKKDPIKEI